MATSTYEAWKFFDTSTVTWPVWGALEVQGGQACKIRKMKARQTLLYFKCSMAGI